MKTNLTVNNYFGPSSKISAMALFCTSNVRRTYRESRGTAGACARLSVCGERESGRGRRAAFAGRICYSAGRLVGTDITLRGGHLSAYFKLGGSIFGKSIFISVGKSLNFSDWGVVSWSLDTVFIPKYILLVAELYSFPRRRRVFRLEETAGEIFHFFLLLPRFENAAGRQRQSAVDGDAWRWHASEKTECVLGFLQQMVLGSRRTLLNYMVHNVAL